MERSIAYVRYLKTLTFNWTLEMHRFKEQFKLEVIGRVDNDGMTFKNRTLTGGGGADIGTAGIHSGIFSRGIQFNAGSLREIQSIVDNKRRTKTIKWKELVERTLAERIKQGTPYPEYPRLLRTGRMLRIALYEGYEYVWKSGFLVGTPDRVAYDLHYGNIKKGIPPRPFYFASNNLVFSWLKTIHLKVLSAFRLMRGKM